MCFLSFFVSFYLCNSRKISIFATVFELARHLEVLLLSNDCVAVPDFGGFVAHYVSARFDETDGMFIPPTRTIGFNPQIKMNDSLLAQSYVEAYDISYPEALRRIEQETDRIRHQVMTNGSCELEGLGVLTLNDEGNYCFTPCEAGLLTPSLYGLSTYDFSLLKPQTATSAKPVATVVSQQSVNPEPEQEAEAEQPLLVELIDVDDEEDEEHAIRIKMSWIRNAVAIAAAIVLFFMLTTPVANSNLNSHTMSALKGDFIKRLIPKDTNMAPATPVIPSQPKTEAKKEVSTPSTSKSYCLVLASQVKQANAEIFAQKLRERGFKDTDINVHNGVIRVVYGHFKSENDAYIELHKLRFEEDFEEAWVYKRKTEG